MNILDSPTFKRIMYFKFFMVIFIWGITPLLIPRSLLPFLGFSPTDPVVMLLRIWGIVVLLNIFVYLYIFRNPHSNLSKYLLLFGVLDNGGLGIILLVITPILSLPWGVWVHIPFQLFFGYWFWRFYSEGFKKKRIT